MGLILAKKTATSLDKLCAGLPAEFKEYMSNVTELKFKQAPDYEYS